MTEQHAGYVTELDPLPALLSDFYLLCLMHTSEVLLRVLQHGTWNGRGQGHGHGHGHGYGYGYGYGTGNSSNG